MNNTFYVIKFDMFEILADVESNYSSTVSWLAGTGFSSIFTDRDVTGRTSRAHDIVRSRRERHTYCSHTHTVIHWDNTTVADCRHNNCMRRRTCKPHEPCIVNVIVNIIALWCK